MSNPVMVDKPGALTVEYMREYFERCIRETSRFASSTPLGTMEINGKFSHYMHADTDTMWIGFAIGMRCAERISRSKEPA